MDLKYKVVLPKTFAAATMGEENLPSSDGVYKLTKAASKCQKKPLFA